MLALLRRGSGVLIGRVGFCAGVFARVLPSLFSPGASIGQNVKFGYFLDLVHCQLFTHLAVTHILMECADHGGRMNIWDVVLHLAEPLYLLAQVFTFLLGNDMQITRLAMTLMASSKGANKLMTQIRPRRNGIRRQVHQP